MTTWKLTWNKKYYGISNVNVGDIIPQSRGNKPMKQVPCKNDIIKIVSGNVVVYDAVCMSDFIQGDHHITDSKNTNDSNHRKKEEYIYIKITNKSDNQHMKSARQTWVKI